MLNFGAGNTPQNGFIGSDPLSNPTNNQSTPQSKYGLPIIAPSEAVNLLEKLPMQQPETRAVQSETENVDTYHKNPTKVIQARIALETTLLRDILYVFQGIDGLNIVFDAETDTFAFKNVRFAVNLVFCPASAPRTDQ